MKNSKIICLCLLLTVLCLSAFPVMAAFKSQVDDIKSICDFAVEYVNSGSTEVFTEFMSEKIEELFNDDESHSDKFIYLFEQDPELLDKENNQLSKTVAVIGDIYVNGGTAKLKQSDIDKNVIPGYGVDDYESDDAEEFMEIINEYEAKLTPVTEKEPEASEKDDAMPPEKNKEKKDKEDSAKSSGGASVGTVILVSILVSAIVFAAGTYAVRQGDAKKRVDAGNDIDDDDVFNLRLAVKSMQTSLQKADGNFKELDKLRIQVDEMDEKLEHITEYLRKLNKSE